MDFDLNEDASKFEIQKKKGGNASPVMPWSYHLECWRVMSNE